MKRNWYVIILVMSGIIDKQNASLTDTNNKLPLPPPPSLLPSPHMSLKR